MIQFGLLGSPHLMNIDNFNLIKLKVLILIRDRHQLKKSDKLCRDLRIKIKKLIEKI